MPCAGINRDFERSKVSNCGTFRKKYVGLLMKR